MNNIVKYSFKVYMMLAQLQRVASGVVDLFEILLPADAILGVATTGKGNFVINEIMRSCSKEKLCDLIKPMMENMVTCIRSNARHSLQTWLNVTKDTEEFGRFSEAFVNATLNIQASNDMDLKVEHNLSKVQRTLEATRRRFDIN